MPSSSNLVGDRYKLIEKKYTLIASNFGSKDNPIPVDNV